MLPQPLQRVDKPIDTLSDVEKEGKSVRRALVGVQRYVRGRAGRKQAKAPEFQGLEVDSIKYLI